MIDFADLMEAYRERRGKKAIYDDSFLNDTREEQEHRTAKIKAVNGFVAGDIVENFNGNIYKIIKVNSEDIEAYNMICYTKTGRIKKGSMVSILNPVKIRKI